jgi:hypothetical protein
MRFRLFRGRRVGKALALVAEMERRDRERGELRQRQDDEYVDAFRIHHYTAEELAMLRRVQSIESEHMAYAELESALR